MKENVRSAVVYSGMAGVCSGIAILALSACTMIDWRHIQALERHVQELSEQVQMQARQIQSLQAQIGERR